MTQELIPAVMYMRMSKEEQCESIQSQRSKTTAHFNSRYKILAEYIDEGRSGSKDTHKRTDFLAMIHDLTMGRFKEKVRHILCLDLSRFGRLHTIRGARYKEQLLVSSIKLDTVIDGMIDWSKSTCRIIDSVKSEANHHLSLLIAEKGLQGRIRVTKEGRPNQTTPYGMAKLVSSPTGEQIRINRGQSFRTPKTWASTFIPGDEREVEAVRFMYVTYVEQDLSYNELARIMNQKGFPLPGQAAQWQADTLTWMLQNPVYIGALRIGVSPKGEFFRVHDERETSVEMADKSSPLIVHDKHPRIIDQALWDKVQTKIQRSFKKRRPPRNQGPYSLSGIVYCGNCGRAPVQILREKLKQIDTRLSVWFRRKKKGRGFDLDKVRIQAQINGEVCYEYSTNAAS